MNPNSSNMCIRYSVWVIEEKYTHNLPIYLLYIIYNKIGANWCINPKRVKGKFKSSLFVSKVPIVIYQTKFQDVSYNLQKITCR